ncbi:MULTISPECIES: MFS transporter [Paenibacillus]|uniref:MFS transporter n=1 Tax=Paenibacillus TaxID=44249 RepID=UPI000404AA66|nr:MULTISPECIES: MFS transporter [Paenibacillus]
MAEALHRLRPASEREAKVCIVEEKGRSSRARLLKFGMVMSPRVWLNARIDLTAACLFSLFNVVMNQFYLLFALKQGASDLQAGLLAAAPAIGLVFSPLWASLVERSGRPMPFVVLPNLIGRLLLFLPALFPEPGVYVAAAVIFQLLMGIQAPAYASLISQVYPSELRGRLMGYVRMAAGAVTIPLAYLVGIWADASGPAGPLMAASVMGVSSILLFKTMKLRKQPPRAVPTARFSFRSQWDLVRSNRPLAVFLLATTFAGFGNMLANPLYQIVQVQVLNLTSTEAGYARVAYFAALLLTYLIAGRVLDRFDIRHTLLCGICAYAVVPMLYGLWGTYEAVIVGNAVQGIGEAIWDIGILAFVFRLAPGREGTVFGLHLMLFGIRGSIGPLLGTAFSGQLTLMLLIASACGWIGTLLFFAGSRDKAGPGLPLSASLRG